MIRVLIADDHPVVRLGLRQILAESSDVQVGREVGSAQEVLQAVAEQRWDVVVLDISLPGGNGIELMVARVLKGERVETQELCVGDTCVTPDQFA